MRISDWSSDVCSSDLREVFGPVLHVIRWKGSELAQVVEQINATGYGLTLGIHSRIDDTVDYIASHARVGNCYVNRNQLGAVVGVQPFGGERSAERQGGNECVSTCRSRGWPYH